MIERYGVYWVNLDTVVGSEIAKTRPAVVVSQDAMNRLLATVVVCPLTTRLHLHWPSRVQTTVGSRSSEVAVDQIRTIDKARVGSLIGILEDEAAASLRDVVTAMYGVLSVD